MGSQFNDLRSACITGFLTWDVCQNNVVGDEIFASIYGLEPNEAARGVTIETILARITQADRERMAKETHDAILNGKLCETCFDVISAGLPRRVVFVGRCLLDPEGMPTFFTGTISCELGDARELAPAVRKSAFHRAGSDGTAVQ